MFFVYCVSHAFASVHCCLGITCWERADLLALVGDVYCIFVTFRCDILCQVWYLIVSFLDLCRLTHVNLPRLPGVECSCDVLDVTYIAIKLLQSYIKLICLCIIASKHI